MLAQEEGEKPPPLGEAGEESLPPLLSLPLVLGVPFVFPSMEGEVGDPPLPDHNIFP